MKTKHEYKTNIICHSVDCKFNSSHRTEHKRGFCKSGKIAVNSRNMCLDKFTDDDNED